MLKNCYKGYEFKFKSIYKIIHKIIRGFIVKPKKPKEM